MRGALLQSKDMRRQKIANELLPIQWGQDDDDLLIAEVGLKYKIFIRKEEKGFVVFSSTDDGITDGFREHCDTLDDAKTEARIYQVERVHDMFIDRKV